jgi:uncharacterized coiled-coil protein SlyX
MEQYKKSGSKVEKKHNINDNVNLENKIKNLENIVKQQESHIDKIQSELRRVKAKLDQHANYLNSKNKED